MYIKQYLGREGGKGVYNFEFDLEIELELRLELGLKLGLECVSFN